MKIRTWIIIGIIAILLILLGLFSFSCFSKHSITSIKRDKASENMDEATSSEVASLIVPHHLVARELIEGAFSEVKGKNNKFPDRIIIISPNHFNMGGGWLIGSDEIWKTENGDLKADKSSLEYFKKSGLVNIEPEAFGREHGILDILPFVAKYFPEVPVVPLMLKDGMPDNLIIKTAELMADLDSSNTLLILSSDFSHELDDNISQFHDRKAIAALNDLDFGSMKNLETDCLPGLEILARYSQLRSCEKFNLVYNSSSSRIYGNNYIGSNTSYVTGYYSLGEKNDFERSASFMFFGDLMLDRDVRTLIEREGSGQLYEKIRRLFWSQDLNIANLEGPITGNSSVSVGTAENEKGHFKFTFDPATAGSVLKNLRIGAVSLGNNHILNFGPSGLVETKNNLDSSCVRYFGEGGAGDYLLQEISGRKIALISYNAFSAGNAEKAVAQINETKNKVDAVIIYAHWGNEYALAENENQRKLAHQFIDAGADLVIGSHPHVVQPIEIYKDKAIFYSLGNFIFDQYFSENVRERLAVGVSIEDRNNMEFYLAPMYLEKNGQLALMEESRRTKFFGRIADSSKIDGADGDNMKNMILRGRLEIKGKACDNCNK